MHSTRGTHQITRALSDGTGLSQEEIKLLIAATALATVVLALLRAAVAFRDAWPGHHGSHPRTASGVPGPSRSRVTRMTTRRRVGG